MRKFAAVIIMAAISVLTLSSLAQGMGEGSGPLLEFFTQSELIGGEGIMPTPTPTPIPTDFIEPPTAPPAVDYTPVIDLPENTDDGYEIIDDYIGPLHPIITDDSSNSTLLSNSSPTPLPGFNSSNQDNESDGALTGGETISTPTDESETEGEGDQQLIEPTAYAVTISAVDAVVSVGDEYFSLSSLAQAVDETGGQVPVNILQDGGFNINIIGTYAVTFSANHPVSAEAYYATVMVTVSEATGFEEVDPDAIVPEEVANTATLIGTSDARYRKYQQYRDIISSTLDTHISSLNLELEARITMLMSAFPADTQRAVLLAVYEEQNEFSEDGFIPEPEYIEINSISAANWSEILAVFVAKSSLDVENPLDLFNLRKISFDTISDVFWDMHDIRFEYIDGTVNFIIAERSSEEMALYYGFDEKRLTQLDELMQPEFQRLFAALTGDTRFVDISPEREAEIRASLPENLNMQRENIVLTAYSLVGQVKYFWGGKYAQLGWNPLWGVPKVVTSLNSPTTGTVRPLGLDCSGYLTWVFVNAAGDISISDAIGNGSNNQWSNSKAVGFDKAKPGDIAFCSVPGTVPVNHVGIVVEVREDGAILVAHCSSSMNNVVVTEAWASGFRYIRRPAIFDD